MTTMSASTPSDPAAAQRHNAIIAGWLYVTVGMVFAMVVLGGVTRLTHSGLSMVEWRPITGWLPPLNEAEWTAVFEKYKQSPEFRELNWDMTLGGFKGIFWLEFLHRLWGRLIGVVFFVPFVVFVVRGWVDRRLGLRLAGLFVLGGAQGVMGWYMVKSGLVDQPDVSQYRLAAHLILALVIMVALVWVARGLSGAFRARWQARDAGHCAALRRGAGGLVALVLVTAFSGALVAGLDAGLTYNTFPLMDGDWVPDGIFTMTPIYLNFFENITTVQFDHRVLAVTTFTAVGAFWLWARGQALPAPAAGAIHLMLAVVAVQAALGIATLLLVVPVPLAALHQAGAVVLLIVATWVWRELTPPPGN